MSNGVLGIPPAAGKNINADPFRGCLYTDIVVVERSKGDVSKTNNKKNQVGKMDLSVSHLDTASVAKRSNGRYCSVDMVSATEFFVCL